MKIAFLHLADMCHNDDNGDKKNNLFNIGYCLLSRLFARLLYYLQN